MNSADNAMKLKSGYFPSQASDEATAPADTELPPGENLNQRNQLSHAQLLNCKNCKINNVCCFTPLIWW